MKEIVSRSRKWIGWPEAVMTISCAATTWLSSCAANQQSGQVSAAAETGKGGAELWAENCIRCHNIRSPSSYSPAQWEVVMMHMRVRANLTPEEHKKILEFLKSGS